MTYASFYEVEVAEGLEAIASQETDSLLKLAGRRYQFKTVEKPGVIQFSVIGEQPVSLSLTTAKSLFYVVRYPVPRPKALLGDQHYRRLVGQIQSVVVSRPGEFNSFYIGAAGRESRVIRRLEAALAKSLNLKSEKDEGDLLIRLRRPLVEAEGWEVLVRTTPRPLSTRSWRVCNFPGALNASVARGMVVLSNPSENDRFCNLAVGSGTLLIERLLHAPARRLVGLDLDPQALICCRQNLLASAASETQAMLVRADGIRLPFPEGSFDVLMADLPFGGLVGNHRKNILDYPQILTEATRVSSPGSRFVVLTHEVKLMNRTIDSSGSWQPINQIKINLGGLHPRIFILRRLG